jgi:hypothetical protein
MAAGLSIDYRMVRPVASVPEQPCCGGSKGWQLMARRKGSCRKPLEAQDGPDIRFLHLLTGCALRCQYRHTPDTFCAEKQDV